jgi:hypothetical protein
MAATRPVAGRRIGCRTTILGAVVASHSPGLLYLCDRILHLRDGRLIVEAVGDETGEPA